MGFVVLGFVVLCILVFAQYCLRGISRGYFAGMVS
jgi:hypothetical protein